MFTLIFLVTPIILAVLAIRVVLRVLGFGRRFRPPFAGFGNRYNQGFGSGFGPRRHRFGGGLFTLLALVALDRLFTRRF